ncbi:MAG: multicopper oxidase domain-containing protein [Yoonia sp.]|uniref:multicopper oxidase domain-containing protein n=1 Tax=Yoonia sp. TaxID=2212373 RepID=UPI003EF69E2D
MTSFLVSTGPMTNRRNLLRGTALTGVVALSGSLAHAAPALRRPDPVRSWTSGDQIIRVQDEQIAGAKPADMSGYERVTQTLVQPPLAPEHDQIAQGPPKIVEIEMVIDERLMVVDEFSDATIWALTFNGSVPGPLIIVHEGDFVELTLKNPESNLMEHNVDFHASTGGLGGGALTHVFPGEQVTLRWKATVAGCYTYHCAPGGAMRLPRHERRGYGAAARRIDGS